MRIKSLTLAIVLLIFVFGGVFISDALGIYKTESSKVAGLIGSGESAGEKNPEDIKGSYSFEDINKNFNIDVEELAKAFEVKDVSDILAFKCKDLETYYAGRTDKEIGTDSVRLFVAFYKGIDFDMTEDIYLPSSAVEILKTKGNLNEEQLNYIENHRVTINK